MLEIDQALAAVLSAARPLPPEQVPLADALGQALAEGVCADRDSPPFDKALMDGYAVRAADLATGRKRLRLVDEVTAGQSPRRPVGRGEATRIMTGAPLPAGADAVVAVEQTGVSDVDPMEINFNTTPVVAGRNILPQGASVRAGQLVVPAGRRLRPQDLGCLAELGQAVVTVHARPRVAILSTGDELVSVAERPGPGQIRNSNGTMLAAQVRGIGALAVPLGIARDDPAALREAIASGLACDVLLLSGGVSAGKLDLVPAALAALGVRQVFHKVRIKPGQPLWFGVAEAAGRDEPRGNSAGDPRTRCCVFGLPGNPVSSMVCCEVFVRAALRKLLGIEPASEPPGRARLAAEHFLSGNRPTYHPARLEWTPEGALVTLTRWVGSADLCGTALANSMVLFPRGETSYPADGMVDVYPW